MPFSANQRFIELDQFPGSPAVVLFHQSIGQLVMADGDQRLDAVLLAAVEHAVVNNNQEGDSFCFHPLDYYLLFPRFGFLSDIYNLELV